jgi:hypothetical protein
VTRARRAALVTIAAIIAAASLTSFAESYRGLYDWAREHGLSGLWAAAWPLQLDTFIAVGELALFVALVDRWSARSRTAAWAVTLAGLAASVAGNVGHVHSALLTDRATAAVPPLAAAAALAVGLGVLKRVVGSAPAAPGPVPAAITNGHGAPGHGREAAERFAADLAAGEVPSVRAIRREMHLGQPRAQEVHRYLTAIAPAPEPQPGTERSTSWDG